jgi:hypothetical protein
MKGNSLMERGGPGPSEHERGMGRGGVGPEEVAGPPDQEHGEDSGFDLERMSVEDAVRLSESIMRLPDETEEQKAKRADYIKAFDDKLNELMGSNLPKGVALHEAMAASEDPETRATVALGLGQVVRSAPREGLMLWVKLLTDPDPGVSSSADESIALDANAFDEQPMIDSRIVLDMLEAISNASERLRNTDS